LRVFIDGAQISRRGDVLRGTIEVLWGAESRTGGVKVIVLVASVRKEKYEDEGHEASALA